MGRKKVGAFIRALDYPATKEEYEDSDDDPNNKLQEFENYEDMTLDEILDGYAAFAAKVGVKGFPAYGTPSYWLGYSTVNVLDRLVNACDAAETEAGELKVGKAQFEAWLSLLEAGPGSAHLDIMSNLDTDNSTKYLQSCSKEALKKILPRMKINVTYNAKNETREEQTYASSLSDKMQYFYTHLTEAQLMSVQPEFLDVYGHFLKMHHALSPELCQYIYYFLRDCVSEFPDENPYQGLSQIEPIKKHLAILEEILKSTDKDMRDLYVEDSLKKICKACVHNNQIPAVFPNMVGLVKEFAKRKNAPPENSDRIFDVLRINLFREDSFKATTDMFKTVLEMAVAMTADRCALPKDWYCLLEEAIEACFSTCSEMPNDVIKLYLEVITNMLASGQGKLVRIVRDMIEQKIFLKCVKWKDYVQEAKQMIVVIGEVPPTKMDKDGSESYGESASEYQNFLEKFFKQLVKGKVIPQVQKEILQCGLVSMETHPVAKEKIGDICANDDYLDLTKEDKATIHDALERCYRLLTETDMDKYQSELASFLSDLLSVIVESYKGITKSVSEEDHKVIEKIILTSLEGDSLEDRLCPPHLDNLYLCVYFKILSTFTMQYMFMHEDSASMERCFPIIKELVRVAHLACAVENEEVETVCYNIFCWFGTHPSPQTAVFLVDFVDMFLKSEKRSDLFHLIYQLYKHNPAAVNDRLQEFCDLLGELKESEQSNVLNIVSNVASLHPEVITQSQVDSLFKAMVGAQATTQLTFLNIFRGLASTAQDKMSKYFDQLMDDKKFEVQSLCVRSGIIANLATDQTRGAAAVDYLMKYINHPDQMVSGPVLGQMTLLVRTNTEYMQVKYKDQIEALLNGTADTARKQNLQYIMDVLEGKSIEDVIDEVQEHKENLADLDVKVGATMNTVISLGDKVIEHDQEISTVQKGLDDLEEKVEEVETDLGETKIKVEEVDNKTMSNAPRWSRDLTRIMNPEAESDWRLLASRLGYNNDDIRAWATQNDPCMALLSEWYATHKTSEATHGVLTALQEMNRMDGAIIVENAMKTAEGVVEDEEFEYPSPPQVFLSYQWGVQPEVKLLKQHLSDAGYDCWMDIGQMGGGDKLFSKIDNGIRGAKVVISCVTEKYAQSPNCNREVNLAVNLNKPIIPLMMEKLAWPPKGSMGPIFGEYVFIRFFQRGGEETKDQRFWPLPKFQELLMQLNFYAVPDPALIKDLYAHWWTPIVEEIVIDKNKGKNAGENKAVAAQLTAQPPDSPILFLSYQWGKQPEVKALYQKLVSLGYTVWMDIYQMGGGDSLYDKIDRGMRGCKVVVSCVTPKYALSANCRREVSLADALKKPVIPLLMEQMKWPPDGPMSMVFTELLFINVYRNAEVIQKKWTGDKFDELMSKIEQHVGVGPAESNEKAPAESKPAEKPPVSKDGTKDANSSGNGPTPASSGSKQGDDKKGSSQGAGNQTSANGKKAEGSKSKSCVLL